MGFSNFKVTLANKAAGTGVTASLKKIRGAPARLSLTFSLSVIEGLHWADGDMLEVLLGDGDDHGKVRLRKNASVGTAKVSVRQSLGGKAGWVSVNLGNVPAFVDRSEGKRHCQWVALDGGWLEITLPSWAAETGGPRRAPALSGAVPPARAPGRTVTPNLMGDPPKGRSALDQRADK